MENDVSPLQELTQKTFSEYKKSQVSQDLIKSAIMDNDFMKNLDVSQIKVRVCGWKE